MERLGPFAFGGCTAFLRLHLSVALMKIVQLLVVSLVSQGLCDARLFASAKDFSNHLLPVLFPVVLWNGMYLWFKMSGPSTFISVSTYHIILVSVNVKHRPHRERPTHCFWCAPHHNIMPFEVSGESGPIVLATTVPRAKLAKSAAVVVGRL